MYRVLLLPQVLSSLFFSALFCRAALTSSEHSPWISQNTGSIIPTAHMVLPSGQSQTQTQVTHVLGGNERDLSSKNSY